MDRLPIVIDGVYHGFLTAKATPEGTGYTVFPSKWIQASMVDGAPTVLGALRIGLPPSFQASVKLSFSFYPVDTSSQDMMYSICEAAREEDPTPYVHRGRSPYCPMVVDRTFVDTATSTSLLVSRSTAVQAATLVSEGSSLNLNKPSTVKSGVYRVGIGMENPGVDERVYLDKANEDAIKAREALDEKHMVKAKLEAREATYKDTAFSVEEWLKDHGAKRQSGGVGMPIGEEWKIAFGAALRTSLQCVDTLDPNQPSPVHGQEEDEEEESAGGAGGLFDDDDDDWGAPRTCKWNGCDPGCSMAPPVRSTRPARANLFTRNQTTSSYRVNTDHLTNRFTFGFAVELVDGFDESKEEEFQTTFYTIDTGIKRIKKELSSQVIVVDNQIRTLEQEIKTKENVMTRSYENRVALIVSAMTQLGQACGEVLTRQALESVWGALGIDDDVTPPKPLVIDDKTNNAIDYFRPHWSEDAQLSLLFDSLLTQTFALSTELLKAILADTKAKRLPFYSCVEPSDSDEEESVGGAAGVFDDDDDDW